MSADTYACARTRNRAFINPEGVPERSIRAAVRMCCACPSRAACALDGMRSGGLLAGGGLPPRDVILGGVVCKGTDATLEELAEVACG